MPKGSDYERKIAREISLWWSDGESEDWFWRSQTSGGRATTRAKQGKTTHGQHGDIAAVDPRGISLIDKMVIEIKRGYSKHTIQDVFDRAEGGAQQIWETWHQQITTSAENARVCHWLMIVKRDQRVPLVFVPTYTYEELRRLGCRRPFPFASMKFEVVHTFKKEKREALLNARVCVTTLDAWFRVITPKAIKELY